MSTETPRPPSYLVQIRGVPLLPRERVCHSFTPSGGINAEPTPSGRLLVTTTQRILSFGHGQKGEETVLVAVQELAGVVVKSETRSSGSLVQGVALMLAGVVAYLVVGYWLADRLRGPNVPFINLDVWALVILAALIWGGWLIGRHYFARELGQITFQGTNWAFSFPYTGEKPTGEVQQVVRDAFLSRGGMPQL